MAPVLKILGVQRLPPGGSLGTGKRGTVPKIWRAVPIFLTRVNGVYVDATPYLAVKQKDPTRSLREESNLWPTYKRVHSSNRVDPLFNV